MKLFLILPGLIFALISPARGEPFSPPALRAPRPRSPRVRRHWKCFLPANDPLFRHQWHLHNTGQGGGMFNRDVCAEKAWDITRGTSTVVIAIFDDGFDMAHPDLSSNVFLNAGEYGGGKSANGIDDDLNGYVDDWRGWDFIDNDNDPSPATLDDNHGTAVAGFVSAVADNGEGVAGLAHRCRFLPIRIFGAAASNSLWAEAIRYAADLADVLSISVATGEPDDEVYDALNYALTEGRDGKGCVIFAALGNDGIMRRYTSGLAAVPEVVSVSGSSDYDRRSTRANYGPSLSLVCPAGGGSSSLLTTDRTGTNGYSRPVDTNYVYRSGTSVACPQAAAGAALIISRDSSLSGLEVRRMLEAGCDKVDGRAHSYDARGWNQYYGSGRLNAWKALTAEQEVWDNCEPDNVSSQASSIAEGELQYRSLSPGGDIDWVSFGLTATSTVQFTVQGATNTYLRLYDDGAGQIAEDSGGGGSYSFFVTNLPAGDYYASVESYSGASVPRYGFHFAVLNTLDVYEPDNVTNAAKVITPRSMQYRTMYPSNDVDWAEFTLTNSPSTKVSIRTMGEWNGYLEMELRQGTNLLGYSYNTNARAHITNQLAPGTYRVMVRDFDGFEVTSYQLLLETYETDQSEPDNSTNTARVITSGERLTRTLYPEGDSDWFRFTVSNTANALIMTDTINPLLDPVNGDTLITLYGNGTNSVLDVSDEGNNASFSAIYKENLPPGEYYVQVRGGETNSLCPDYYLGLDVYEKQTVIDTIGLVTNGLRLTWPGDASFVYRVQYSGDILRTQAWTTAVSNFEGSLGENSWTDDGSDTEPDPDVTAKRYYRIITE
ncbi:MAG: S8 family serine peptidase [Kiritimatiellia bacterium]